MCSRHALVLSVLCLALLHLLFEVQIENDSLRWAASSDPGSWTAQAFLLLEHGSFAIDSDGSDHNTWRPPLIPLLFAAGLALNPFPGDYTSVIIMQTALIIVSGLYVKKMMDLLFPQHSLKALYFFSLNPIIFISPHLIIAESLYLFFITAGLFHLVRYATRFKNSDFISVGVFLGLACLTRPTPMFLIIIIPLTPLIIAYLDNKKNSTLQALLTLGFFGFSVSMLILTPWLLYMQAVGHGVGLSHPSVFQRHIWDQVITIYAQAENLSHEDAAIFLEQDPEGPVQSYLTGNHEELVLKTDVTKHKELAKLGLAEILKIDGLEIAEGLTRSFLRFNFTGGSSEFKLILNIPQQIKTQEIYGLEKQGTPINFLTAYFSNLSGASLAVSLWCIGFAILSRGVEFIGILWCLKERHLRARGAVFGGIFLYFMGIMLFLGSARYRVPVEPALTVLFFAGISVLQRTRSRSL